MTGRARRFLGAASVACLLGFLLLATLVQEQRTRALDIAVTDSVQTIVNPGLDLVASLVTVMASAEVTSVVALALSVRLAQLYGWRAAWAPLVMFLTVPVEVTAKFVINQAPMDARFLHMPISLGAEILLPHGFPSGHAVRTAFLYGLLVCLAARLSVSPRAAQVIRLLSLLALLVLPLSRLYTGVHWFTDVLGGLLVGAAALLITAAAMPELASGRASPRAAARSLRGAGRLLGS